MVVVSDSAVFRSIIWLPLIPNSFCERNRVLCDVCEDVRLRLARRGNKEAVFEKLS